MASESGILFGDANDAVANAVSDRLAHPFDLVVELAQLAVQPICGCELLLDELDLTLDRSCSSEVRPLRRLLQLGAELVELRPIFPRRSTIDDAAKVMGQERRIGWYVESAVGGRSARSRVVIAERREAADVNLVVGVLQEVSEIK